MSGRLPSGVLVSALLRRVAAAGGFATVLARGDAEAGAILVLATERGGAPQLLERGLGPDGRSVLVDSTPAEDIEEYCRRRRSNDPDLWLIELDIAAAPQLAAETLLQD